MNLTDLEFLGGHDWATTADMQAGQAGRSVLLIGGVVVMGWLSRVFGAGAAGAWSLDEVAPPWGDRPSIFEHVKAHIVPGTDGLSEGGDRLPDEAELYDDDTPRWVSGGLDGAFGHHGGGGGEKAVAKRIFSQLKAVLRSVDSNRLAKLYESLKSANSIDFVDPLLELITKRGGVDPDRLHALAEWLARGAADREPVKLSLAWLGVLEGYDDRELFVTLARHEEFTLYAVIALTHQEQDPERTLWGLARHVDGWGRISIVERLAETQDPEIKAWLLREGYKNSIMYEYLAYTCAKAGGLKAALSEDEVDDALLDGAGDLLQTLIDGIDGPAQGIDDYEDGAAATQLYLQHLKGRADALRDFLVLKTIERFLVVEDGWDEREPAGWTKAARKSMLAAIQGLVDDANWRSAAERGLKATDDQEFWVAARAAEQLGIDTWDEHYERTKAGEGHWYRLMRTNDVDRVKKVIALAEANLPLEQIASGPSDSLGLGEEFVDHGALDFILQDLGRFPGLGWSLVQTGLKSPVVRNRTMSLKTLGAWTEKHWPDSTRQLLEECLTAEPDEEVKASIRKLLAGARLLV